MTPRRPSTIPSKPSQGREVVGKIPAWELWAETETKLQNRGAELLAKGAFTAADFAKKTGWTVDRSRKHLEKKGLHFELANDSREYRNARVRFFFPPGVKP